MTAVPEKIEANINTLELGESILASDLVLPEGSELISDPSAIVVQCVEAMEEAEETPVADMGAEPEVIGRKAEDGEEGGE